MKKLKRQGVDRVQIGIVPGGQVGDAPNPDGLLQTYTELRDELLDRLPFILENHIHEDLHGKNITFSLTPIFVSRSAPNFDYVYGYLSYKLSKENDPVNMLDTELLRDGERKNILSLRAPYEISGSLANQIRQEKEALNVTGI